MKKNVLVFGLIAGTIVSAVMMGSMAILGTDQMMNGGMVLGYASMVVAFSFVFVGIRNFRNHYNQGVISFGKAFQIGLYISLIASSMYVITWLIDYYCFIPDFMDKYTAHVLAEAKAAGTSAADLAKQTAEMDKYKEMYKNPVFVVLLTYAEVLPVGLLLTLISAFILKRKEVPALV